MAFEQILPRLNVAAIRKTFTSPHINGWIGYLQRTWTASWIDFCTRRLRHVHGLDRIPRLDTLRSFLLVANHRSYFDLFVATMVLSRSKRMRQRVMCPVRSNFFYTNLLGSAVNGVMSFFSMYPPISRDPKQAVRNHAALDEIRGFLGRGDFALGMHPEGRRKKDGDPYTLLPAQSGVGRTIYQTRLPVIPVFVNGLGNNLLRQVARNFFVPRTNPILLVFGRPIDFGSLLDGAPSVPTYRAIADRVLEVVRQLGQEERVMRKRLLTGTG